MVYYQKMTPEGYKQIEDEIAALKADRPRRVQNLKEARALGDLSENTEYSTAKRELRHLDSRVRYLNKQLKYAEIIEIKNDGKVNLGKMSPSAMKTMGKRKATRSWAGWKRL